MWHGDAHLKPINAIIWKVGVVKTLGLEVGWPRMTSNNEKYLAAMDIFVLVA